MKNTWRIISVVYMVIISSIVATVAVFLILQQPDNILRMVIVAVFAMVDAIILIRVGNRVVTWLADRNSSSTKHVS